MSERPRIRVAVLGGGRSSEHEVSLRSAASVVAALDPERFDVVPVQIDRGGAWQIESSPQLALEPGDKQIESSARLSLEPGRRTPGKDEEFLVRLRTWPGDGADPADHADRMGRVIGTASPHGLPVTWE